MIAQRYWDALVVAFVAIAVWESFCPRVPSTRASMRRWGRNAALSLLGIVAGASIRFTPIMAAVVAADRSWGLLNGTALPSAFQLIAGVLLIDAFRYVQHRALHGVPVLWRLHQVHHADEHFDLTTGLRFHPLEVLLTHASYILFIWLVAPPVSAVLIALFAIALQNLFAHANVVIPSWIERPLRVVLITPEMHRVHHSIRVDEQNTNFGAVLPFWDRWLGTYCSLSPDRANSLQFGLRELQNARTPGLMSLVIMPFAASRTLEKAEPGDQASV